MLSKILDTRFTPPKDVFEHFHEDGYRWFVVSTNEDGVRGWVFCQTYEDIPQGHSDVQAHYIGNRTEHVGSRCPACGNDFYSLLDCEENAEGEEFCTYLLCGQGWEITE